MFIQLAFEFFQLQLGSFRCFSHFLVDLLGHCFLTFLNKQVGSEQHRDDRLILGQVTTAVQVIHLCCVFVSDLTNRVDLLIDLGDFSLSLRVLSFDCLDARNHVLHEEIAHSGALRL